MSSSEFSKSATVIESNIPVPKRTHSAAKRSKNCAQLPELQKYIETIIRASNEKEDAGDSEKGKLSRERKCGKYSVCRRSDKKSKQEITKVDCQMSGRKSKNKAKAPLTEAVSNGDEISSCMFVSAFDDPRNWKTDETRNGGGSQPAVENCLKKLFPNPYRLANVSALLGAPSPEKGEKDELGGETLPGNPRSNAFTQTEVQSGKADDELVTADIEIKPCERASNVTCTVSSTTEVENVPRPVSRKDGRRGGNPPTTPRKTPTKTPQRLKSNSTINISSRASSLDSVSDVFSSHTRTMTPKQKNSKSTVHSGKSSTNELKSKSSVEDFLDDLSSDYDIGKLRLLSMSDSDDSIARTCDDSTTNGMYEADDIKDLREIFDVMDKATESFFELSLKKETNSNTDKNEARNKKVLQLLDELIREEPLEESRQSDGVVLEEIKEETSEKEETKPKTSQIELTEKKENVEPTTPEVYSEDNEESKSSPKVETNSAEQANSNKEEDGEKMDEVLQFMYDCLTKFSKQEKKRSGEFLLEDKKQVEQTSAAKKPRKPPSDSSTPEGSSESLSVKNYPRVKEIQSESSTFLGESKRKLVPRHRSRLKQDKNCPTGAIRSTAGRPPTAARSLDMNSRADSIGTTGENRFQTVESQNELGSYSEQAQVPPDWNAAKPILPHSVRLKKTKTDTQKSIKDALENEEKLLANYLSSKPKILEKAGESKSRKLVVRNGRTGSGLPLLNDFKRTNSSFVICVSSLPRNLRTMAANKTSITLSPSLSLSLSNISRNWCVKPLPYYTTMSLKKIPVILDIPRSALELTYNKIEGTVVMMGTGLVKHIARPVCLKQTVSCTTVHDERSFERSECSVSIRMRPMKKSLFVESSTEESVMGEASVGGSHRVDSILEALEKTEGRLMMLEQNELINSESSSTSGNYICKCGNSELEWENDSGHEKVHELLLRTYNLQQKLHRYLHRMSVVPPVCPLMRGRCPSAKEQRPEDHPSRTDEGTTAEIEKSDHATSYNPPSENSPTVEKIEENEDDDSSSVYSFKSSNDFSEPNEIPLEKPSEKTRSGDFLKKIFNEIESFRQNFTSDKKEVQSTVGSNLENSEENRLTEYDPKTPAKVLKTVFKGKKSTTELTIGLKDVPMTKVSNISVEKRKFSPNHTKISICILKEKPEAPEQSNSVQEMLKPDSSILRNKFSTLYFDRIRPSVSRCRTEYSRVEDDLSKTSTSTNDSDDDDDYKSVASSFSNSDVVTDKKEVPNEPATPPPPPKTFTKYRFDFYRKMDLSLDQTKTKPLSNTLCRYKELQPLKEALTEMQIRMRSIKQDTYISNDYYERALKLAKMSAGYCQNCGNRAVIPKDTFGYYKTLLPRRCSSHRQGRHVKMGGTPAPSFYSFRSSNPEMSESFCELDVNHSSPYLMNHTRRSSGAYLRSSLHNMPILIGRM